MSNNIMEKFISKASSQVEVKGKWREEPVSFMEFFTSEEFLNEKPYPGKQTDFVNVVNQLIQHKIIGNSHLCEEELQNVIELVVMYGKGSGKDFLASTALAYMLYVLLCFNDPQGEFGLAKGARIDLINMAINSNQANNVFFKELQAKLDNCPWFNRVNHDPSKDMYASFNDYQLTKNEVRFANNITAHSAHSEADSFEGFNPIMVIFDEIDGFHPADAEDAYMTLSSSALSRFNDRILLIFISFPRSADGFMMSKYKESEPGGEVYGLKGTSWEVNPSISRDHLQVHYDRDPGRAKMIYESLTEDTLTWTDEGIRKINEVEKGTTIYTRKGPEPVTMFIESGEKETFEVVTEEGFSIEGSSNHPMLIVNEGKDEWKTIGELTKGDKIYLELNNHLYGKGNLSATKAYILGTLVGRGEITTHRKTYLTLSWTLEDDCDILEDFLKLLNNEFEQPPRVLSSEGELVVEVYPKTKEYIQIVGDQKPKTDLEIFNNIFEIIRDQPKHIVLIFLRGVLDVGQFFDLNGNLTAFCCSELKIARMVQQLFLYTGIKTSLTGPDSKNYIDFMESDEELLNDFGITFKKEELIILVKSLVSSSDLLPLRKVLNDVNLKDNVNRREKYVSVKEVKNTGVKMCYDLWVEPNNEFIGNGMGVHNCDPPLHDGGLFTFPEKIDNVVMPGKRAQNDSLVVESVISKRTLSDGSELYFTGLELHNLSLDPTFTYYLGGDGGVTNDSYVLCLMHGEPTLMEVNIDGEIVEQWINKPVEDLLLEWKPNKKEQLPVDLLNVADVITQICNQVPVRKAMFDKFNSADVVQRLMSYGVDAEDKNFSNPFQVQIYQNLKNLIYSENIALLDHKHPPGQEDRLNANEELKAIQLLNGGSKIDHSRGNAKDFSDARAAAAYICSTDEPQDTLHFAMPVIKGMKSKK